MSVNGLGDIGFQEASGDVRYFRRTALLPNSPLLAFPSTATPPSGSVNVDPAEIFGQLYQIVAQDIGAENVGAQDSPQIVEEEVGVIIGGWLLTPSAG